MHSFSTVPPKAVINVSISVKLPETNFIIFGIKWLKICMVLTWILKWIFRYKISSKPIGSWWFYFNHLVSLSFANLRLDVNMQKCKCKYPFKLYNTRRLDVCLCIWHESNWRSVSNCHCPCHCYFTIMPKKKKCPYNGCAPKSTFNIPELYHFNIHVMFYFLSRKQQQQQHVWHVLEKLYPLYAYLHFHFRGLKVQECEICMQPKELDILVEY